MHHEPLGQMFVSALIVSSRPTRRKIMNTRAAALAAQIQDFNREMIACVRGCSDADWRLICKDEDWSVGVVARHVGDGHYQVVELARMIIKGDPLPDWSMADIVRMGNDHARAHADCTREEVVAILKKNGRALEGFVAGLSEDELDRKGRLPLLDQEVSAQQILEMLVMQSGGDHLQSIRKTMTD
jgi:hypothetical protein